MNDLKRLLLGIILLICSTISVAAIKSTDINVASVEKPPQKALKIALKFVDSDVSGAAKIYGTKAAFAHSSKDNEKVWLIAIQAKNKEYCSFVNVTAKLASATDAGSYVGCQICRVEFKDFNGDGSIDALYHIKTKSNVADAWVDEEALFISRADGFCKARVGRRFVSSTSEVNCD
jgi:hypothetical protein